MKNRSLVFRHIVLIIILIASIAFGNDYAFSLDDTEWVDLEDSLYHDGFFDGDNWANSGDDGQTWGDCSQFVTVTTDNNSYSIRSEPSFLLFGLGIFLRGSYSLSNETRNERGLFIFFFIPIRSPRENYTLVSRNFECFASSGSGLGLQGEKVELRKNNNTIFNRVKSLLEPLENGLEPDRLQIECVETIEMLRKNKDQIGDVRYKMIKSNVERSLEVAEILAANPLLNHRVSNVMNELITAIKSAPSESSIMDFFRYALPVWLEDDIKAVLDDIGQLGSDDLSRSIKKSWTAIYN